MATVIKNKHRRNYSGFKEIAKQAEVPSLEVYCLQPNSMQVGFINNLRKIYEAGEDKALLISATGTGKTQDKYKAYLDYFRIAY